MESKRVGWLGLALLASTLASVQTRSAAPAAPAAAPAGPLAAFTAAVQAGSTKAAVCLACHGPNGNSTNPEWPTLAGQNAAYIAEQLKLYRSGARPDPVMMSLAQPLSDADIADLAVYYSAQTPVGLEADPSYWQAGEKLYLAGDPARQIPACVACHGPIGRGNPAAGYPALRAQHAVYTVKQLSHYASGARYKPAENGAEPSRNGHMMVTLSKRLTPEDIRNVASYLQGMR